MSDSPVDSTRQHPGFSETKSRAARKPARPLALGLVVPADRIDELRTCISCLEATERHYFRGLPTDRPLTDSERLDAVAYRDRRRQYRRLTGWVWPGRLGGPRS